METLRKILEQADASGLAIGHFNISDLVTLNAVSRRPVMYRLLSLWASPKANGGSWAFAKYPR